MPLKYTTNPLIFNIVDLGLSTILGTKIGTNHMIVLVLHAVVFDRLHEFAGCGSRLGCAGGARGTDGGRVPRVGGQRAGEDQQTGPGSVRRLGGGGA